MTNIPKPPDGKTWLDIACENVGYGYCDDHRQIPLAGKSARAELADLRRDNEAMSHNIDRMDKLLLDMNDKHRTLLDAAVAVVDSAGPGFNAKPRLIGVLRTAIEEQRP